MKDSLEYNGFLGSVHFDGEEGVFFGKVEGVNDLVTFEGSSVKELNKAFKEAVEDYLSICEDLGKEPLKSYKGSLNVRLGADLHLKAVQKATTDGLSLNQFILKAVEKELSPESQKPKRKK